MCCDFVVLFLLRDEPQSNMRLSMGVMHAREELKQQVVREGLFHYLGSSSSDLVALVNKPIVSVLSDFFYVQCRAMCKPSHLTATN